MLRDIPKITMIMFIGIFLIFIIVYYSTGGYKQDSTVKAMTETLRTTAIANRDDSSRIEKGLFKINKNKFEDDFKQKFNKSKNIKAENLEFNFNYLDCKNGGIKAIKVKVKLGDQEYQASCILNIAEKGGI